MQIGLFKKKNRERKKELSICIERFSIFFPHIRVLLGGFLIRNLSCYLEMRRITANVDIIDRIDCTDLMLIALIALIGANGSLVLVNARFALISSTTGRTTL